MSLRSWHRAPAVIRAAQRSMPLLLQHLRRGLGWFLSPVTLIRLEGYGNASENLYYRLVLDDVAHQQEELDKQFVVSCGGHWRSVRPRMKANGAISSVPRSTIRW